MEFSWQQPQYLLPIIKARSVNLISIFTLKRKNFAGTEQELNGMDFFHPV
jgi:hypothetical protein